MGSRQLRPQFIRAGTAATVDLLDLGECGEHVLGTFKAEFWLGDFHGSHLRGGGRGTACLKSHSYGCLNRAHVASLALGGTTGLLFVLAMSIGGAGRQDSAPSPKLGPL
jgi:hypothetical protein